MYRMVRKILLIMLAATLVLQVFSYIANPQQKYWIEKAAVNIIVLWMFAHGPFAEVKEEDIRNKNDSQN